jgi:phage terminase large subunit-like protein
MSKTQTDKLLIERWRSIGPVEWAESDHGWIDIDGAPVCLTLWQRDALGAWWTYRETVTTFAISNVKKTGKTFVDAVLLCWRWLTLPGQHFAAANDLDQSAGRQFSEIVDMIGRNAYLKDNTKITKNEIIFTPTGSTLTALAVDSAGNAGANFLTTSHTESWGICYEEGIRAFEELTPPPGRFYGLPCLRVVDSYAGHLGESETWHSIVDRGLQGQRIDEQWPIYLNGGLLLFHIEGEEAQRLCFRGTPDEAQAYYTDQRATLRENTYKRLHLNERTAGESSFVTPEQWAACLVAALPADGRRLVLGADASTSRDLTALVGTAYNESTGKVEVLYSKAWTPKRGLLRGGKPTVDLEATIGAEVTRLHDAGLVDCIVADPYQLHSLIISWEKAGIQVIELAQNAGRVEADQALFDAIDTRAIAHSGEKQLTEHVLNSVALETPRGLRLAKEKTSKKIDLAVALSMSHHGTLQRQKRGGSWVTMPNPFYGQYADAMEAGYKVVKAGDAWVTIPPDSIAARHPLTAEAVQKCRQRAHGCARCVEYYEQSGEYARQDAEAAAKLQEGRPLLDRGRPSLLLEPEDHYRAFMQKFNLKA